MQTPLSIGQEVELSPEPENPYDARAVVIKAGTYILGYINRLQTAAFRRWLSDREVKATIERLNGSGDRPRAYMFVTVRPKTFRAAAA